MGSKNISQRKGVWAELQVIRLLQSKNWELLCHRQKIDSVEIDLIFKKDRRLIIAEVKFLDSEWRIFERISKKQIFNIQKISLLIRRENPHLVTLAYLFLVNKNAIIKTISIDEMV